MWGRLSMGALALLLACDGGDGGNSGTDAWDPDTEGTSTGGTPSSTSGPTTSSPTGPDAETTSPPDPTTSDPDPTDPDPTVGTSTGSGPGQTSDGSTSGDPPPSGCSEDALMLVDLLNGYRAENGLGPISASSSMCMVADTHVADLSAEAPHEIGDCNLHSWSDAGPWSACCYTPDHAAAQCMWDKPRELTDYPGNGYENAAWSSGDLEPAEALEMWINSPGHNAVMINEGIWADITWNAVGAGFQDGYAVLWFGEEPDPAP